MTDVPVTDVRTAFHRQCPRCCFAKGWKTDIWDTDEATGTMIVEYTCRVCGLVFAEREPLDDGEAPDDGQAEDLAAPPIEAPEGGDDV